MHTSPRFRSTLEAAGILLLRALLYPVPPRLASLLGEGLGWSLFALFRLKRRQTLENLEKAFGDAYSPAERELLAKRCYRHIGAVILEFFIMSRLRGKNLDDYMVLDNPEVLAAALAKGRGLVMAVAHLGNWELIGSTVASKGYPITAYVGRQHNPFADAFINRMRRSMGMGTISKQVGMRGMLRTLKKKEILALLPDQHYSRNVHFVRFFGRLVSTAPGMGALARHTGADVVFAQSYKVGRFRYRVRFHPLDLPPPGSNEEYELLAASQQFMDLLEEAVRSHPEQYFWMHNRWRPPPPEEKLSETNRRFLEGLPPPEISRRPKVSRKPRKSSPES